MTLLRSLGIGLLILLCATIAILLVTHEGRVAIRTAMLIPEVLPGATFQPLRAISEEPLVNDVAYPYSGGQGQATLFRPAGSGIHGAVILFLGINPDYSNDALQRFSRAVARQGAVVMLVHGVALDAGRLSLVEVDSLVGAFRYLRELPYVNPKRMGFAGFCIGGSLALQAAGDPRIAGDVRFVNSFGGYYSAETLLAAMTTRTDVVDGKVAEPWEPNSIAAQWFLEAVTNALPTAAERAELQRALQAGGALTPEQRAALPARLRSLYSLLQNRDPSVFGPLYQSLPDDLRDELAEVAPLSNAPWLQAKVFLMADRNDTYIPYTESKLLNMALRDYPRRVFTEFDFFEHMTPGEQRQGFGLLVELAKLYYHLYLVLLELS